MDILLQKLAETQEIMRDIEKKLADVGNRLDQIHALAEKQAQQVQDESRQTEEQDASREDRY